MGYTTVKCSLNKFCKNEFLKKHLNESSLRVSKIVSECYCFANLHIARLLEQKEKIPILNQTFFNQCNGLVSIFEHRKSMKCKNSELLKTFEDYYRGTRPDNYLITRRDGLIRQLNYISKEMETCVLNHLVLNFYNRMKKYLKQKYELDNSQIYHFLKGIYDRDYTGNNVLVKHYRWVLQCQPYPQFVKKEATGILKIYQEILEYYKNQGKRGFTLLPYKSGYKMNYITVDKAILYEFLDSESKLLYKETPEEYLNTLFRIKKFETGTKKFVFFKTDGKTVSITLEFEDVKKQKMTKRKRQENDYDCIVGLDPGLRKIYSSIDNFGNIVEYKSKEYYHDSKCNWKTYKQQNAYSRNPSFKEYVSNLPSPKTTIVSELLHYISEFLKGLDNALELHFNVPFRKWRFKSFIAKEITLVKMCKSISRRNTKTIVGFGNWSNPSNSIIKGNRRGPVQELKDHLRRLVRVVDIDEYKTSKLCSNCYSETKKMFQNVNSVLSCTNCKNIIDRDINGAKNIYYLTNSLIAGNERPVEFCR